MQITLNNLGGLRRELNVTIPVEVLNTKISDQLHKMSRSTSMPGFRPGKIPFDLVKKNYYDSVRSRVMQDVIHETYIDAIKQHNLNIAGLPHIEIASSDPNEACVLKITFEVYPKIELVDFRQFDVVKEEAEINDKAIDDVLAKMCKSKAQWQVITDKDYITKEGDKLEIDISVSTKNDIGENSAVTTEDGVSIILGDKSTWSDFEKPLYGCKANVEIKYVLAVPSSHTNKELAGKEAEFTVKIKQISLPILPDLNDEFAVNMGVVEGGLEKLKLNIRDYLEKDLVNVLKNRFRQKILEKLLEVHNFELPNILVADELNRQEKAWKKRYSSNEKTTIERNIPSFPVKECEAGARRNISWSLLLIEIAKSQKIKVSHEEIEDKVRELVQPMLAYYKDKDHEELIKKILNDNEHLHRVRSELLEGKVIDYLGSQINVSVKQVDYFDLIKSVTYLGTNPD